MIVFVLSLFAAAGVVQTGEVQEKKNDVQASVKKSDNGSPEGKKNLSNSKVDSKAKDAQNAENSTTAKFEDSPVKLSDMKKELASAEKQISEFRKVVGSDHPVLKKLQEKVSQMRKAILALEESEKQASKKQVSEGDSAGSESPASQAKGAGAGKRQDKDFGKKKQKEAQVEKAEGDKKEEPEETLPQKIERLRIEWTVAKDEEAKKAIKAKLVAVLEQQFDRDLGEREKKLVAAEKRLNRLRQQFEKMVKSKKRIIDTYADATTTSWEHPRLLKGALGGGAEQAGPRVNSGFGPSVRDRGGRFSGFLRNPLSRPRGTGDRPPKQ